MIKGFTEDDLRQANEKSDPIETLDAPRDWDLIGKDNLEE